MRGALHRIEARQRQAAGPAAIAVAGTAVLLDQRGLLSRRHHCASARHLGLGGRQLRRDRHDLRDGGSRHRGLRRRRTLRVTQKETRRATNAAPSIVTTTRFICKGSNRRLRAGRRWLDDLQKQKDFSPDCQGVPLRKA